jgi:hypothetical protein
MSPVRHSRPLTATVTSLELLPDWKFYAVVSSSSGNIWDVRMKRTGKWTISSIGGLRPGKLERRVVKREVWCYLLQLAQIGNNALFPPV